MRFSEISVATKATMPEAPAESGEVEVEDDIEVMSATSDSPRAASGKSESEEEDEIEALLQCKKKDGVRKYLVQFTGEDVRAADQWYAREELLEAIDEDKVKEFDETIGIKLKRVVFKV